MSHSRIKAGGHGSSGIGNDFTPSKTPAPATPAPQSQQVNDLLGRGVGNALNKSGFGSDSQTWTPGSTMVSLKSRSSSSHKPDTGGDTKPDSTSGGKRKRDDETDPNAETEDGKKKKKKRDDENDSSQAGGAGSSDGASGTPEEALMNIVLQRAVQRQTQTRQKMQEAMKIKDDDD
ncbi:protein popB [Ralstonia pseudosolanacearum]|uniref:Protein PopB n=1 Tax=Ralstonia solanacearum TaxID=305 RepID=A0A0S4TP49_RALSL|nr:protein popB [Ralstonia solanacearum]CUV11824.1 Protein PopB [Ralstonia solanacearum]